MLAVSVVTYLVANVFYEFQIFLLWVNSAPGASAGRLLLGHICCILLEDHSFFFTYTMDTLVEKQQNIPVAASSTSLCRREHTFGPEDFFFFSVLICSRALAEGTPGEHCWFAQEVG